MKLGMLLHPEHGVDAVMDEARCADEQGYDSVWVADHLMDTRGVNGPDGPLDSFTLMTAIGAVTKRTRLAWAMLNPSFHYPAVFAKRMATLDCITHGRVICTVGAGWFKDEYLAYGIPLVDDHDERIQQERELIQLTKELWTHPAPEKVTFEGKFVQTRDLPFTPAPVQKPHPPIWIGGDSQATLGLVKQLADGWVMLTSGNPETLSKVLAEPDWPQRPMTLVRNAWIFVAEKREDAIAQAAETFNSGGGGRIRGTLDEFIAAQVVGTPDECLARLREIESWGINYTRVNFGSRAQQDAVARLVLPLLP